MCTHSIQIDPQNEQTIYVAISAAGVFRSDDGGELWAPKNKGTATDFRRRPFPEVGQCVHKLLVHPAKPERLWQQNHCGVYRSDDRGDNWERLEDNGLPTGFGFPIALHPTDPGPVAFVVLRTATVGTASPRTDASVSTRPTDGGQSWKLARTASPIPPGRSCCGRTWRTTPSIPPGSISAPRAAPSSSRPTRARSGSRPRRTAADPVRRSCGVAVTVLLPCSSRSRRAAEAVRARSARPSARRCASPGARPAVGRARRAAPARERLRGRMTCAWTSGLDTELTGGETIRVIAAIAGGWPEPCRGASTWTCPVSGGHARCVPRVAPIGHVRCLTPDMARIARRTSRRASRGRRRRPRTRPRPSRSRRKSATT